ncbi:hypothetical protein PUN28_010732 [Cardiocondyla obscurior]|uniref:Uncharacterized protein n=1 Tax=Cardiocondyla obscurior TaxID=286306 RepID=A0AAW2FJ07_9HYME
MISDRHSPRFEIVRPFSATRQSKLHAYRRAESADICRGVRKRIYRNRKKKGNKKKKKKKKNSKQWSLSWRASHNHRFGAAPAFPEITFDFEIVLSFFHSLSSCTQFSLHAHLHALIEFSCNHYRIPMCIMCTVYNLGNLLVYLLRYLLLRHSTVTSRNCERGGSPYARRSARGFSSGEISRCRSETVIKVIVLVFSIRTGVYASYNVYTLCNVIFIITILLRYDYEDRSDVCGRPTREISGSSPA